jgi:alcohol dehydrogenase (cytochrome c)
MRLRRFMTAALGGTVAAMVALPAGAAEMSFTGVTQHRLENADKEPQNWITVYQNYSSHRFSRLDQINRNNVANLRPVFAVPISTAIDTGGNAQLQGAPLVDNGMMFFEDGWGTMYKVDVAAGDRGVILWKADPGVSRDESRRTRGIALWADMVLGNQVDGRVTAIDRSNGEFIWDEQIARTGIEWDFYGREQFTSAPLAVEGKLLVSQAFGDAATRGWLAALDIETGAELWRTYVVPGPGEPGHETWLDDHNAWKTGGGGMWTTGSYDVEQRVTIWGTGNPVPMFDPEYRPGDNLFTNTAIAFNIDDGSMKWYFQYVPNESWDYDEQGVHVLINIDGRSTVQHFGRNGFFYRLDATNGEFINAAQYVDNLNWTAGLDPKTGWPIEYDPNMTVQAFIPETHFMRGDEVETACPNYHGGSRWQPPALNPDKMVLYQGISEGCFSMKIEPVVALSPDGGIDNDAPAGRNGRIGDASFDRYGAILSVDAATGQVLRKNNQPYDNLSGVLATAGGLIFTGTLDGSVAAFNDETLQQMWHFNTGISFKAPPMTYAVGGRQYIAIMAGGDAAPYAGRGFEGDVVLANMNSGAMLFVFAL